MIDPQSIYELETGVELHDRRDCLLVGGARENGVYLLNDSAARILREFDGKRTLDEVAGAVSAQFGASHSTVAPDVLRCVAELEQRRLVRQTGQSPARPERVAQNAELFSHMLLELTWDCNLRCKHCYMEGGKTRPATLEKQALAGVIREFKELGGQSLTLSGGEPMLYPGWDDLAEAGYRAGLQLAIMTNGTYLDSARFDVIRAFDMGVGLGLDGVCAESHDANRGKGSFADTMRALALLERNDYLSQITICFTPMGFNVYDLPGIIEMMLDRKLPRLYVSLLEERGRAEMFWGKVGLTERQKEWLLSYLYDISRQTLGRLTIEVTHHNDIFYRLLYDADSSNTGDPRMTVRVASEGDVFLSAYLGAAEHSVGRIGAGALPEMLNSARATEILERWENRADRIGKCRACAYKSLCKGGSAVLAYSSHGTFEEPDGYCNARIGLFDSIVDQQLAQLVSN